MSNERTAILPLAKIVVGYNPRRFFDPIKHEELVASIRRQGVLQSLLVRPGEVDDTFILVCGGRRYRAALEALGPVGEIPVVIREMTDQEALDAAASENEERDNTSETEQADAAVRMLAACTGDKAETARRLGWSASKLARRLALADLADPVKVALDERRIKVGHAELLAAVPNDKQAKALETILSAGLDVAKTRDLLMKVTQDLAHACFDKSECTTCPFNSGTQRALFETHVDDGHCTNSACFTLKTEAAEQVRAAEEAAAAEAAAASAPATAATTDTAEQTDLSAALNDASAGDEPATTNPQAATGENDKANQSADDAPIASAARPAPAPTPAPAPAPASANASTVTAKSLAARAKALREATWRTALARHFAEDLGNAWQVLLIAAYSGSLSDIKRDTLPARSGLLIGEGFHRSATEDQIDMVRALSSTDAAKALAGIGAAYARDVTDFNTVAALAQAYSVDIRSIWRVDQAFLDLYTKDELKFIAQECGLVDHMGTKPFGKLLSSKKADLIAGMLNATGFDWAGRLPSALTLDMRYAGPVTPAQNDDSASGIDAVPAPSADPQPDEPSDSVDHDPRQESTSAQIESDAAEAA